MKNSLAIFIGILIIVVLVAYMVLFQVRYDEVAVKATFGSTDQDSIKTPSRWPRWRWPWPIQSVRTYPTRLQLLEHQLTQIQTNDEFSVIVATYLAWRIEDPLLFFKNVKTVASAEEYLKGYVGDVQSIISQYKFNQLVNTESELMLETIEAKAQEQLDTQLSGRQYGIQVEQFGIRRILLPESVTNTVFEYMRETRQRLAENTRSSGKAEAQAIRSEAELMRDQILVYANNYAEMIRAKGDAEAEEYLEAFKRNPRFAIFLDKIKTLEKVFGEFTTFFLPAEQVLEPDKGVTGSALMQENR